jgi:CopG-like RHH_1 or ribbon-helix-helix domain, RHH_5
MLAEEHLQEAIQAPEDDPELFDKPTQLYRYFDSDDRLLYIGVSISAVARLEAHKNSSHWFNQAGRMTWETLPDRYAALKAEKEAISALRPPFNHVHKPSPAPDSPDCAAMNTPSLSVRIPVAVRDRLEQLAQRDRRSLSNLVCLALQDYVSAWRGVTTP